MLPIFLCPTLQSQFRNVFSMDLTELEIDDEYIDLISSYRQRLGSWVYELVRDAEKYFDAGNSTSYSSLLHKSESESHVHGVFEPPRRR